MSAPLLSLSHNSDMHEKQINRTVSKCQSACGHLTRCSSSPSSLSTSACESETGSNGSLIGKASQTVVALHRQLTIERERNRQLLAELVAAKQTGLELVLHRVDLETTENRQLQDVVQRQQRIISNLQQQLKGTISSCNSTDGHFSAFDNSSDCCSNLPIAENCATITCSQTHRSYSQNTALDTVQTDCVNDQRAALESRVKEMENIVEQWQVYGEQRDQYARVLAQRCAEFELIVKKYEQQAKADRAQLKQQAELIDMVDKENRQLKTRVSDIESRLGQAARRLHSQHQLTKAAQEQINVLQAQLVVYKEDFISEQQDRQNAQRRISDLEHQLVAIVEQLRRYEPVTTNLTLPERIQTLPVEVLPYANVNNYSSSVSSYSDNGFPLLIARGSGVQHSSTNRDEFLIVSKTKQTGVDSDG